MDEFAHMQKPDRASMHEAMEQQQISIAKGAMCCQIKSRCTVIAACNPRFNQIYDSSMSLEENTGIVSSLLT